jgi:predicted transcriptional regulator
MDFEEKNRALLLELSADIVTACISQNHAAAADVPALIASTYRALKAAVAIPSAAKTEIQKPFVSVKKSVTPDYIICLEDGKKFKSMKSHLANLGMTPEQYRRKWDLPDDYPIVAPNYTASRSEMAKKFRLGRRPKADAATEAAE